MRALVATGFGLASAILSGAAVAASCTAEIGRREADVLVRQCRDVSPATRPPCNASNACALVREEIARGCDILGSDAPAFCPPAGQQGDADGDDDEDA